MCIRNDVGEFVLAKTGWFAPLCDINVGGGRWYTHIIGMSFKPSIRQHRFCP